MCCASAGADRPECGICADPAYVVIPQGKKKKFIVLFAEQLAKSPYDRWSLPICGAPGTRHHALARSRVPCVYARVFE